ncbi:MAG TPA: tetratricopeptide repeat protein [Rhodothermales bacterium]
MRRFAATVLGASVAMIALCGCADAESDAQEASVSAEAAEQSTVHAFWSTYRDANRLRLAGDLEGAADGYRAALQYAPDHQDALYYLGNVLLELRRFDEALDSWRRLRAVAPEGARAHRRIGDVFSCLDEPALVDLDSAYASYRRAFNINKEETGSLIRLGEISLLQGRLEDARRYFSAVRSANEESLEALLLGGYVQWQSGHPDDGRMLFDEARSRVKPLPDSTRFSAEGDTKSGAAMTRDADLCRPFQRFTNDLRTVEDPAVLYGRIRTLLDAV